MICIVNYGLGNSQSVKNMLSKMGLSSLVVAHPDQLEKATSIILPGVGHFEKAMNLLEAGGWIVALNKKVILEKIPTLGICLGMQLFFDSSEEGFCNGLGWISGRVVKFNRDSEIRQIPNMGWREVFSEIDSPLFKDEIEPLYYYFVHSYYVMCVNEEEIAASTFYGNKFTCAVIKDNIMGVQFHPEKSHIYGRRFLSRYFASLIKEIE